MYSEVPHYLLICFNCLYYFADAFAVRIQGVTLILVVNQVCRTYSVCVCVCACIHMFPKTIGNLVRDLSTTLLGAMGERRGRMRVNGKEEMASPH